MAADDARTWFITGASSGFGRCLTEEVLKRGERVVAAVRSVARVGDLYAEYPDTFSAVRVDVTSEAEVKDGIASAVSTFARLDVVVNNAGYGLLGALEEVTVEQMERNLATNLMGPLLVMRAALPVMRKQGSGFIVNMSAAAAFANYMGFAVYGGAKAALDAASEALASEVAPLGINVMVVAPGPFRTDFIQRSLDRAPVQMDEYRRTCGKFAQTLDRMNGRQPGDPRKAAHAIIGAVNAEHPPFRLVLGAYAYKRFRTKLDSIGAELTEWESAGAATDYGPVA